MTVDLATVLQWIGAALLLLAVLGLLEALRQTALAKARELLAREQQILLHAGLLETSDERDD